MLKNRFGICLFLLSASLLTPARNTFSQDEIIRIDTALVTIPVTVLSRDGRYISNLNKDDFEVLEDGEEQKITFFETTEQPVTIFLLLDLSKSMEEYDARLTNTANAFLSQLRPKDQLLIAYFCDYTKMLRERDSVENIRKDKIKLKFCGKHTQLYEAVEYAFEKIRKIDGRKALVLFSDGIDAGIPTSNSSLFFVTAKSNLRDAEELDAPIFTVRFGTLPLEPPKGMSRVEFRKQTREINSYMPGLARLTGGRYFQVEDISDLEESFSQVAQELSQRYSIGYHPKNVGKKGERRQIKVKVRLPNAAVRARSSYVFGSTER